MQKVVADLRAKAGFGLRAIFRRLLGFAFFFLQPRQPGTQHFDRRGAIFVLAAFILALHDNAGGKVRQPDGAGSFVHVLAAGAAGPEHIFANIFVARVRFPCCR